MPTKAAIHSNSRRKNAHEISNFKKPADRLMYPCAFKKVHFLKTHVLSSVQKKIFPYIQTPHTTPGLFNHRIRSWLATLSQSILIRYAFFSHILLLNLLRIIFLFKKFYSTSIWIILFFKKINISFILFWKSFKLFCHPLDTCRA